MSAIGSAGRLSTGARVGVAVSVLVVLMLVADGAVGLFAPRLIAGDLAATGFAPAQERPIALLGLACTAIYAIPRTRTLGAVLISGFLGGAICTHFRVGEVGSPPQIVSLVLGALAWLGIYLQDARVRALLPITTRRF